MVEFLFASSFNSVSNSDLPFESRIALCSPQSVNHASEPEAVLPLIRHAEAEAVKGSWVALVLSYEAASAFDGALRVHAPGDFPLAWAATFAEPCHPEPARAYVRSERVWTPGVEIEEYKRVISRIHELIARGDCYQVNYTFPLTTNIIGNERAWFDQLCLAQSASFAVYIDLGRFKLLSLSPELFFERKNRQVITRPMKGTIKRGRWSEEDLALARQLSNSEKDRAENVMIVDLLRNDLGRVSEPGSISVTKLFQVEQYETLWQMTSTIESFLRPEIELAQLMAALFPCGSVTGAPKVRTMEIINQLEAFPRRAYTGTIGLIRPGGDCIFNVAIRTLLLDERSGEMTLGVGSGITIDSVAAREYDECLLKASFLQYSASRFDLLETFLIEDGEIFLLQRHLDRLMNSARYFGFVLIEDQLTGFCDRLQQEHSTGAWRVRLLVSKNGEIRTEHSGLETNADRILRVKLALEPVDSCEPSLFHKTTNRNVYNLALGNVPGCDDVVLWNERGEITESTVANVVISLGGQLVTPPLTSGLLPGTFRAELLAARKIHERVIYKDDLIRASSFYLINSVQRWRRAMLLSQSDTAR